jgi:hypothetical protein
MPGASFCQECGTAVPAESVDQNPTREYVRTNDPSGYTPMTIASDGIAVPGEIAGMKTRTGAWLITNILVNMTGAIPVLGFIVSLGAFIWTMSLYRRGQDVGASITALRVVRDTGELAGFYHMWTRGLASIISFLAIGAGFWTAYSDPDHQTWHDKWMGTYVVKAGPDVDGLPGTSSSTAKAWFWVSIAVVPIAGLLAILGLLIAAF